MSLAGSATVKDTTRGYGSQVQFSIRSLLEDHLGVSFRGSGPRYMVICPWHDDKGPSLSVDDERGLYHCFGCGKAGNSQTLARSLGLVASKSKSQGYVPRGAVINFSRGGGRSAPPPAAVQPPGWFEVAALEVLGETERARKMERCQTRWRVGKCGECGAYPAYPMSCWDRLCPRCRAVKLRRFLERHQENISPEAVGNLVDVQLAKGGDLTPDDLVEGIELLRVNVNRCLRASKASGWVYAFRLVRAEDAWLIVARVLVSGDEKDGFLAGMVFTQAGLTVLKDSAFGINAREALERLVHWAEKPYVGVETASDLASVEMVLKGRRVIQGAGSLYRVSGGATLGAGEVRKGHCCSLCGSENVQWMFSVDASEVVQDHGPPHWVGKWEAAAVGVA